MKNLEKERTITFDEALEMPEYADFHEVIQYLEKTPFKEVFPKKYEMSLEDRVLEAIKTLFSENPYMPLKDVLSAVLDRLPNDLSAALLLKMTQFTLKKWGKLAASSFQNNSMLQAV
jgi:predicted P-loop ATPase